MQKPKYFRVRIPVRTTSQLVPMLEFLKELKGSEASLNFGEQRNRKEFKYLLEEIGPRFFHYSESNERYHELEIKLRKIETN